MTRILPIALALLLGACTAPQAAVVGLATAKVQAANDVVARTLTASVCGLSVGSYFRLDPPDRRGVALLCGGDPVSIEAIRRLLER